MIIVSVSVLGWMGLITSRCQNPGRTAPNQQIDIGRERESARIPQNFYRRNKMFKQQVSHRIEYLDGLRGIAALLVVFTHFLQLYTPGVFTPDASVDHGYEKLVAGTPLNLLFHGKFWVAVFFVLSGFVLCQPGIKNNSGVQALSSGIKRYPRLAIPALGSTLFAWTVGVMTQARHYDALTPISLSQRANPYADVGGFGEAVFQGLYGAFFLGQYKLSPVLWTIGTELIGSLLVIALVWMLPGLRRRMLGCAIIVVAFAGQNWMPAFALGIIAAELVDRNTMGRRGKIVASALCFVGAIWFGSFPYFGGDSGVWRFLPPASGNAGIFFATLGAFMLVVAASLSEISKSILSSGAMRYLGGLSFSVYLVHFPIVMAFSSFIILHAVKHVSYGASLVISLSVTLFVVWICSVVFKKVFDDTSISVSKWIGIKISKLISASSFSSKEVEKS